jgi:hypothetical protein
MCLTMHAVRHIRKQPERQGLNDRMLMRARGGRRPRAAGYFPEVGKVRLHEVMRRVMLDMTISWCLRVSHMP